MSEECLCLGQRLATLDLPGMWLLPTVMGGGWLCQKANHVTQAAGVWITWYQSSWRLRLTIWAINQ